MDAHTAETWPEHGRPDAPAKRGVATAALALLGVKLEPGKSFHANERHGHAHIFGLNAAIY
jgi:hypothetical protein